MQDVLERDPVMASPPSLPPYLQRRKGPERRWIVLPDISRCHVTTRTVHDGVYTIHYVWMARWDLDRGDYEIAHVNTRKYRQWLDTFETDDKVPPHIQFGGAVTADPENPQDIYTPWVEHARRTFY
jgi:hypothetical protein